LVSPPVLMICEAEQPLSNNAAIAIAAAIVRFIVVLSETETVGIFYTATAVLKRLPVPAALPLTW
jgi:hypothetical protein